MLDAEQLKARVGLMTSSLVAGIYPDSGHYLSPLQVKLAIKGLYKHPIDPLEARRGHRLERGALEEAADELCLSVEAARFIKHVNGWSGDSADCDFSDLGTGEIVAVGEAKTIAQGELYRWGLPRTDEIPERVLIQCLWHLYHRPHIRVCHVPVLLLGYRAVFDRYIVHRDDEAIGILVQDAERWYHDYITKDGMPPVGPDDHDALTTMHPHCRYDKMEWTPELAAHAAEKLRWREIRKMATKAENTAASELRKVMQAYGEARGDGMSITYRNSKPLESTDWKGLAESLGATPALIARFSETKPGPRTLTVTALKAKKGRKVQEQEEEAA